jgi:hypothetical protein
VRVAVKMESIFEERKLERKKERKKEIVVLRELAG